MEHLIRALFDNIIIVLLTEQSDYYKPTSDLPLMRPEETNRSHPEKRIHRNDKDILSAINYEDNARQSDAHSNSKVL